MTLLALGASVGCVVDGGDDFDFGGTRVAQQPANPYWGIDHCGGPLDQDSVWNGTVSRGFELEDQFGREISLSDFCGRSVLLMSAPAWSESASAHQDDLQGLWLDWKVDGLVVVTLLTETVEGEEPDREALEDWAQEHGATHPVLADPAWGASLNWLEEVPDSPRFHLLGKGLTPLFTGEQTLDQGAVEASLDLSQVIL